jgi:hypothetical protein
MISLQQISILSPGYVMFLIGPVLVDEAIASAKFSCNLKQCKGACCTLPGGEGAPLLEKEIAQISQALAPALEYLPEKSRAIIQAKGFLAGDPGDYSTACIEDRDCVFVYYQDGEQGGIAKCALEKAYFDGKTEFRKPLSCHLFPIRIRNFGGDFLSYQPFEECSPAISTGEEHNIPVYHTVKEALIRAYGLEWYNQLVQELEEMKTPMARRNE